MKTRLLIVDDEEKICDTLSRYFKYQGYAVDTAGNGREALELLGQSRHDIVVSDIMMPEMNGVELLKTIRREYPMIRVIMITGYVTMEHALTCLRYGADTFIFKPIEDMSELKDAVESALKYLNLWQTKLKMLREIRPVGREV